jgi:hypothetical protein
VVGQSADPWLVAAHALSKQYWGPQKQTCLMQLFLEFFDSVLANHQQFVSEPSLVRNRSSSSSLSSLSVLAVGIQQQQQQLMSWGPAAVGASSPAGLVAGSAGSALTCLSKASSIGSAAAAVIGRHSRHQRTHSTDLQALLGHHSNTCRCEAQCLFQDICLMSD